MLVSLSFLSRYAWLVTIPRKTKQKKKKKKKKKREEKLSDFFFVSNVINGNRQASRSGMQELKKYSDSHIKKNA